MEEVKVVTLEDNEEYVIVDELTIDRVRYVILTHEKEIENMVVRKINIINNQEYLVNLNSEEEVKKVLDEYIKKHHN